LAKTILLIGASGFAGGHFREIATAAGLEVASAARHDQPLRVDLLEPDTIAAAIREAEPDAVVNLAGSASVAASFSDPAGAFAVNALGTVHLLDVVAAERPDAYVLCVSSGEVYGPPEPGELPFREDREPRPLSPYGASKAAMEVVCDQRARCDGMRIGIVRAFNHTGPGQSDSFAASSFARQVAEAERDGRERAVLSAGNLNVERDFSDVRDVAAAYVALCEPGVSGTFNACSGRAVAVRELVDRIADASPLEVVVETDPERVREGEAPTAFGSYEKLRAETGWGPRIPLERTARDLLEWWRDRIGTSG
jgi:GDP-4-dehydro-6-deoxy-D-mannose reductase